MDGSYREALVRAVRALRKGADAVCEAIEPGRVPRFNYMTGGYSWDDAYVWDSWSAPTARAAMPPRFIPGRAPSPACSACRASATTPCGRADRAGRCWATRTATRRAAIRSISTPRAAPPTGTSSMRHPAGCRYDYHDPDRDTLPYDSCAACIGTAQLLRLARWLPGRAERYRHVARETLKALIARFVTPGGVVLHGSWGRMRHVEPGKPRLGRFPREDIMPYGNYWIAECLFRELVDDWSMLDLATRA